MYTHSLLASKKDKKFYINCEWLAEGGKDGNAIGIWLYSLEITEETKKELAKILSLWTKQFEIHIRVFITRENFIDNK